MSNDRIHLTGTLVLIFVELLVVAGCVPQSTEVSSPPGGTAPASASTPTLPVGTPLPQTTLLPTSLPTLVVPSPSAQPTPSGLILYESNRGSGWAIWQMDGRGRNKQIVVPFDEAIHGVGRFPRWSPDGQHYAYLYAYDQNGTRWDSIWIADRDGSNAHRVGEPAKSAAFRWSDSRTIFLYFVFEGEGPSESIYDLTTGLIEDHVLPDDYDDYLEYVCSPGCQKVAGIKRGGKEYFIYDRLTGDKTTVFEISDASEDARWGKWSPDGNRLAFIYTYKWGMTRFSDLYVVQADGQGLRRLTDFKSQYNNADSLTGVGDIAWSPSGEWIALTLGVSGESLLYLGIVPAEGGPVTNLGVAWRGGSDPVWSPDSTKIAFVSNVQFEDGRFGDPYKDLGQWDIYTIDIYTKEIVRLTDDQAMEMHIDWR